MIKLEPYEKFLGSRILSELSDNYPFKHGHFGDFFC
jgi:hypothetical protein